MRKKSFINRLGTVALAGVLALSPFASALTPMNVLAASPTGGNVIDVPGNGVYKDGDNNYLSIAVTTSDVYGTNASTQYDTYTIDSQLHGYWAGTDLNPWHFAHTPEGNSTYDGLELAVYDTDGNYKTIKATINKGIVKFNKDTLKALDPGVYVIKCYNTMTDTYHKQKGASKSNFYNGNWNLTFEIKTVGGTKHIYVADGTDTALDYDITNDNRIIDYVINGDTMITTGAGVTSLPAFGYYTTAYQQHPYYGQISFNLHDKDFGDTNPGQAQGDADLSGAKFAVFNISTGSYGGYNADNGKSTKGYVISDRAQDGLDSTDRKTFIPAYSKSDVLTAYNNYLETLVGSKADGTKTFADYLYGTHDYDFDLTIDDTNPMVPVTVVSPDANGNVTVKELPVGTYLILQVAAGDGYYIDEDFRPVVEMTDALNDTTAPAGLLTSSGSHKVYATGGTVKCPLTYANSDNNSAVFDLTDVNKYIDGSGYKYTSTTGQGNNYKFTDGEVKTGTVSRLKPVIGTNMFNAHDTIIRGSEDIYLADNDDYKHISAYESLTLYTVGGKTYYNQIPQGDGELAFNTSETDKATFTITNKSASPVVVNGTTVAKDAVAGTYEATINKGIATGGVAYEEVVIDLPVDALPYGTYLFEQTKFGEGYVASDAAHTLSTFTVRVEDKIANPVTLQTYNGRNYITNQIVDGGELYTVSTVEGDNTAQVDLAVYNISDHYVYVPGSTENTTYRYETIKDVYETSIKGQDDLTIEQLNTILSGKTPCVTYTGITPAAAVNKTKSLHYGTYLIVVTGIPDGYKLITPAFGVDSIDVPPTATTEDKIKFDVRIGNTVPEIVTEFLESSNKIDSVKVTNETGLYDKIDVSNLSSTGNYRIYGVVVDKATGKMVAGQIQTKVINKEDLVVDKTNPEKASASVEMYFSAMNMWPKEGKTLVAYEYITPYTANPIVGWNTVKSVEELEALLAPVYIGQHKSLADENQTVYVPSMTITAEASLTHGKVIDPTETVVGTTVVGNLEPGNEYKLVSYLYDQAGDKVTDANGNPLSVTETFQAVDVTKTCTEKFDGLDAIKYNNQRLTVYSTLYRVIGNAEYELITKGDADSIGYDPSDEEPGPNQVDVKAPTVKTTLTGKNNAKKVDFSDPDVTVTLTDKITYTNLIVGGKYRSILTLVDGTGQPLLDDDGRTITATHEFEAIADTQTVKISVDFIATEIAGQKVIAYNDLYRMNSSVIKKVAEEHDLTTDLQTVTAAKTNNGPTLVTVAKDSNTKTHTLSIGSSITDTVNGMYLEPNTKYVLVTELAVNGAVFDRIEPIKTAVETDDDGKFTAKVSIGGYNASALEGKKLTVFETLYNEKETKIICEHKDAEDDNQTVVFGKISTVACSDAGLKTIAKGEKVTVVDNIHYEGLTPGYTYTITTTAMLSSGGSGTAVGVPVKTTFTADAAKGDVSVKIILDTTKYAGMDIVMFESISEDYSEAVVLEHKDISDTAQTVTVEGKPGDPDDPDNPDNPDDPDNPSNSGDPKPQTGVDNMFPIYFGLAGALLLASIVTIIVSKRRKIKVSGDSDKE